MHVQCECGKTNIAEPVPWGDWHSTSELYPQFTHKPSRWLLLSGVVFISLGGFVSALALTWVSPCVCLVPLRLLGSLAVAGSRSCVCSQGETQRAGRPWQRDVKPKRAAAELRAGVSVQAACTVMVHKPSERQQHRQHRKQKQKQHAACAGALPPSNTVHRGHQRPLLVL